MAELSNIELSENSLSGVTGSLCLQTVTIKSRVRNLFDSQSDGYMIKNLPIPRFCFAGTLPSEWAALFTDPAASTDLKLALSENRLSGELQQPNTAVNWINGAVI